MGRNWRPKYPCRCPNCNWKGKRAIVAKPCPQCQFWHPRDMTEMSEDAFEKLRREVWDKKRAEKISAGLKRSGK